MEPYNTNKGGGPVAQLAITKDIMSRDKRQENSGICLVIAYQHMAEVEAEGNRRTCLHNHCGFQQRTKSEVYRTSFWE
jgi:hypothetical protein